MASGHVGQGLEDVEITPPLLAELMKCSRFTAYRKMLEIERKHPGVVHRRGKGRDLVAMASVLRGHVKELRRETPADREIRHLRERLQDQERRMDAEVQANLEFRRNAHECFERLRALEARLAKVIG